MSGFGVDPIVVAGYPNVAHYAEAWRQAEAFMEAWNDRGHPRRVGGQTLYEMTLRLAEFLAQTT